MPTDILQKEIIGLGEDDLNLLISFARFLRYKTDNVSLQENKPAKKRKIGFLADAFVSISPDFDETPDCMLEYV